MKIIAKKIRGFYGNKNGLIKPIFKENDLGDFIPVNVKDYPNNGLVFFGDYELLDSDIKSEMFLIENNFVFGEDKNFAEKSADPNSCRIRINYNLKISSFFKPILPFKVIPIYANKFSIDDNRLFSTDGITSDIFFLKTNEDELYGPFERNNYELVATNFENKIDFEHEDEYVEFVNSYKEKDYDGSVIFKIDIKQVSNFIIADNEGLEFLEDFKLLFDKNIGVAIDFTPVHKLHNWALEKLKDSKPKIRNVLEEIKDVVNINNKSLDGLRWNKYISYLESIENNQDNIDNIVNILQKKNFINLDVDSSEIEKITKELEELKGDLDIKSKANTTLKNANINLKSELEAEKDKVNGGNLVDAIEFPNLSKVLTSIENIKELESLLLVKKTSEILKSENDRLSVRKELLEEDIKKRETDHGKISDAVKEITKTFERSASEHTAKLAEAKIYSDLLNGIDVLSNTSQSDSVPLIKQINLITPNFEPNDTRNYISEIEKRLKNLGRDLGFNEVANLVITISQSFITIIAGAPGVGKTSLVEKIARSYGLDEDFGYLEISCAKGWTSSKDLLGFFNPLTNKFQPSKTKLKEALKKSESNLNAPYFILLDEANLSPIEHYWSDFIKLADFDYSRNIKISDNEAINFGMGFRFLATINHDHTTEVLSNRLIDRASIIQINKPANLIAISETIERINSIYSYNETESLLAVVQAKWISEEELIINTLENLITKLESSDNGIIISPRKRIAIENYCKVATGLLLGNTYTALDFAIAQHVLPLINGRGEDFEKNLYSVEQILKDKGMIKSEKLLGKIIKRGKGLKHFKYIYY
jgi:MoxR-like ATPase